MTLSSPSGAPGSEGRTGRDGQRLPPAARVRRGRDIQRVLRSGSRISGSFVDVFAAPSPNHRPRIGVVVPRYGNTAVARNRVRRRLKEFARREWMPMARSMGSDHDVILRAKPAAYGASYQRLRDSLDAPMSDICAR
ncbi:MAG: ribonuclease P protein component [Gemmatimonadota bacterium]